MARFSRIHRPQPVPGQGRNPKYTPMSQVPARDNMEVAAEIDDPYMHGKYPEMSQCERCGIVHHENRWYQSKDLPKTVDATMASSRPVVCPACKKIQDQYPLGVVELRGAFIKMHREDLEGLARGVVSRRMERNPLERIISLTEHEEGFDILTTDERLAQQIGRTLFRSYEGDVTYNFDGDNQKFVRVHWTREV